MFQIAAVICCYSLARCLQQVEDVSRLAASSAAALLGKGKLEKDELRAQICWSFRWVYSIHGAG